MLTALSLLLASPVFCQREDVLKAYSKYKIDQPAVDSLHEHYFERYSFNLKTTIVTEGTEKVYQAKHDPSLPAGSQWVLVTVNGGNPSRLDLNTFNKTHSDKIPPPRPDFNTFKVVKDEGGELVISYQYDPASLIQDNDFMKYCVVKLFFSTQTGRLQKMESEIHDTFKIKMFKADHMNSSVTYQYDETEKRYLPLHEEVSIGLKLLGRPLEMITINDYSNYKKS